MSPTRVVRVTVNGETYERLVEVRKSLADFLRQDLELTGTHLGCEHGVCGACTVLLDGQPVRSCLLFAVQLDGAELQTVEGLARDGALHPIQEAFRDNFALQCGYCTPGFLLTVYDLLRRAPNASREEIRRELAGNICRCTGYHAIVDAVEDAAARLRGAPAGRPMGRAG
jgi:carbon-monoxide dehydrogenase small subunit